MSPIQKTIPTTPGADPSLRWAAAGTLGTVMVAHILLETGVDATFLANVSIERLPLATIAIAFLALLASRLDGGRGHRWVLIAMQFSSAVGTIGLWTWVRTGQELSYYALYLWSGVIGSLVIVRFWLLLGDLFSIGEAKRAFATVAMGGAVGALLGSGIAAGLAPRIGGEGLLLFAAMAYLASAIGPLFLIRGHATREPDRAESSDAPESMGLAASFRALAASPYATQVALVIVLGGMTMTLGDFLFKSVLTEEVAADQLAVWLSRIYLGLNVLSIAILALGVTPIVRRLGVDRSLIVLPSLLGLAAAGVLVGGALAATIVLKLADGTLRYSLHKTASELLYVPMSSALRSAVKGAIDIVGQTGAKATASVLILGLLWIPGSRFAVAASVVLFAGIWIFVALRLRDAYLDVFRTTLHDGVIETMVDHPELDLESAGSLIRALSHPDEERALAALRILAERGQDRLIPSLILYHPSENVVGHALDLFAATGRDDIAHLLPRLIGHEFAVVRAASVRATWALGEEAGDLNALVESNCLVVRVSAAAGLLDSGRMEPEAFQAILADVLVDPWCDSRVAASTAAQLSYHPVYREALCEIARDPEVAAARGALDAIRASRDDWFIPGLIDLLGVRGIRDAARSALMDFGDSALDQLQIRLLDPATPNSVAVHLPRTISGFDSPRATSLLLDSLEEVEHGMIRFKVLRGLETLLSGRGRKRQAGRRRANTAETAQIRAHFETTLRGAADLRRLEQELGWAQGADPGKQTLGGQLLLDLLADKRELACGRLFMMLGLMYPTDDFRSIRNGLMTGSVNDRDSAIELIETLLDLPTARALLAVAAPPRESGKRRSSGEAAAVTELAARDSEAYSELLRKILAHGSAALSAVALYHAGEMGLASAVESGDSDSRGSGRASDEENERSIKDRGLDAIWDLLEGRAAFKALQAGS